MDFKSETSFKWLYSQEISSVKDLARMAQADYLWNTKKEYSEKLISLKNECSWNSDLRNTARAASVLAITGTICKNVEKWILSKQADRSWNNDAYDTAYALIALADMGSHNLEGCGWLIENYGHDWEHPGTTALIITALIKQTLPGNNKIFTDFVENRTKWIIEQRENNKAWKTLATSNLVIQALLLAGHKKETTIPIKWLLSSMNINGSWGKDNGEINTTSLSLISLKEYSKHDHFTGKST
ncbi:MAG: hypothetical protein QCH31_00385 [Methanolobus sp.]|nr:hypothetical protein [Methanolobus sp.]